MSIFDVTISYFKNVGAVQPVQVSLRSFLTSQKHRDKIELLRSAKDEHDRKMIKLSLPAATPSCTCSVRNERSVISHSGFIQFDIDNKENPEINNWEELRDWVAKIPEVAYCALSASGEGVWGLVRIQHPDKHKQHFKALEKGFRANGIVIDPLCSDVVRLRFYSFDENARFNENAFILTRIVEPQKTVDHSYHPAKNAKGDRQKVEAAIKQITENKVDITDNYKDWWMMAAAFKNSFGENDARKYYHAISRFHPNYDPRETDRQFDNVLRHDYNIDLSIFLARCKEYGIKIFGSITSNDVETKTNGPVDVNPGNNAYQTDGSTQQFPRVNIKPEQYNLEYIKTIGELAEYVELNGTADLTKQQMIHVGDYFSQMNPSYTQLTKAFELEYGEPVPMKYVQF